MSAYADKTARPRRWTLGFSLPGAISIAYLNSIGSSFGINTPLGDQQLVLGARTLNVDFVKEDCDGFITADYYVFEYYDFRKDQKGSGGDFLGTFQNPAGGFTIPTQWLDQLVISGNAKEFWTIVAWRERYKLQGMGLVPVGSRKDYTGPFPSSGYPLSGLYPN